MKKTRTVRTVLAGVLVTLLVVGMIPPALAAAGKTITVYPGISIYIDDQKLEPKDANGKPVEVFTYNGTTYLPVRAIAEALGKNVQWDGKTQSVYLGQHGAASTPTAWLTQMDHFAGDSYVKTADKDQDNTGATHYNCFTKSFDRTYVLNGQYSRLSGVLYQRYERRSDSLRSSYLEIYGDGSLLYSKTFEYGTTGIMPIPFDLDVSGVLQLQVKLDAWSTDYYANKDILGLGDVGLWK